MADPNNNPLQTAVGPIYGVNADFGPTVNDVADQQNPIAQAVRSYIAPQPGYTYGNVLPLKKGPSGGLSMAIPNVLRSFVGGGLDLLEGPDTGVVTPQATNTLMSAAAPELTKNPAESAGLNIFAGLGAKPAMEAGNPVRAAAALAQRLTDAGLGRNDIYAKTGMWKDPIDRQMRYEIPDGPASITNLFNKAQQRINTTFGSPGVQTTLDNVINHQELFKAYPDIAKMLVVSAPKGKIYDSTVDGGYTPAYGSTPEHIYVASDLNPVETKDVLLHEIQHAIQAREGFARGGSSEKAMSIYNKYQIMLQNLEPGIILPNDFSVSPWEAYQALAGEVESRNIEARSGMFAQQGAASPPVMQATPWATEPKTVLNKMNPDAVQKAWEKYVDGYDAYSDLDPDLFAQNK